MCEHFYVVSANFGVFTKMFLSILLHTHPIGTVRSSFPYTCMCVDFSVVPLHTKQHSYIICVYTISTLVFHHSVSPSRLVFVNSLLHFSVLQGTSSDQKAVARYKVEEEARKGSKGETVS